MKKLQLESNGLWGRAAEIVTEEFIDNFAAWVLRNSPYTPRGLIEHKSPNYTLDIYNNMKLLRVPHNAKTVTFL